MNRYTRMVRNLDTTQVLERLAQLYGAGDDMPDRQAKRYARLIGEHEALFADDRDVLMVSAPGRTEIAGNHTDHNNGRVIAAAVNLDTLSAVSKRADHWVMITSDGYPQIRIDLNDLAMHPDEAGTTASLVRGIAAKMTESGYRIGGFNAAVTSQVASGSGLSSSAAFEVMLCAIFDALYNGDSIDFIKRAQIAQYAENHYFGKPSGLMDQMASAAGGLILIDFKEDTPAVRPITYRMADKGYSLVVVNTGGSHANLVGAYASMPSDMKAVAACYGKQTLRDVDAGQVMADLGRLRGSFGERSLMRAMHYFNENERVRMQADALENGDLDTFLRLVIASGQSSFMYLQNVFASEAEQPLSLALCMAEQMLAGKGAWRVHGGGFAGTTLNIMPNEVVYPFTDAMEGVFGRGACQTLDIRPEGAAVMRL
jgi:galactokinase